MKSLPTLRFLLFTALVSILPTVRAQNLQSMPPVVVRTMPEAGAQDVTAGIIEVRVTFSKPMKDGAWSWSTAWPDSVPEMIEQPRYDADGKTCVIKVKLEANRTYGYWVNSAQFKNFKDQTGKPAVPYLLAFKTKAQ